MIRFRRKYPIITGMLVLLLFGLSQLLATGILLLLLWWLPWLSYVGEYPLQLLCELIMLLVMLGAAKLLGMSWVITCRGRGFWRSLIPGVVLLGFYLLAGVESLALSLGQPLQPPGQILAFLLCMALVGAAEELTFRGIIAGMIYDRYGSTPAGVWLSVTASSLIFGLAHLSNVLAANLSSVLIQVVAAAVLGMCLTAIYLRGRNLWAVAFLHGIMDICALIDSGIFQNSTLAEELGDYSLANLAGVGIYLVMVLVLLRPSRMRTITSTPVSDRPTVVKLGAAAGLLGFLAGAVVTMNL